MKVWPHVMHLWLLSPRSAPLTPGLLYASENASAWLIRALTERLIQIAGELDAATNIPGDYTLTLHTEMSYAPTPISKVLLLCLRPAEQGGESLLARNTDVLQRLPKHVLKTFERKGGVRRATMPAQLHLLLHIDAPFIEPGSRGIPADPQLRETN